MKSPQKRIWDIPVFLDFVHKPINDDVILAAETKLKVKLPKAYIDLLRIQNGGYTEVTLPESPQTMIWGIGHKFPTILDGALVDHLAEPDEETWCANLGALVPFDGDGHWYLCFDYRITGPQAEPRISYIDIECETDRVIADSFEHFTAMLERGFSNQLIIGVEHYRLKQMQKIIQKHLKVKFEAPEDWANGYLVWRARYKKLKTPEWIWLSHNSVPTEFSRGKKR